MPRFIKRSRKTGLSPGTLIHIGEKKVEAVRITLTEYGPDQVEERVLERVEDGFRPQKGYVSWLNIDGIHRVEIIEKVGDLCGIHPLVLEDIVHTEQRPKVEDYESYLYLVIRMLKFDPQENEVRSEQISLILSTDYLISFQESEGDVFNAVRERIRKGSRIRKVGADYLAYALLDAVVDNYFLVLDHIGEKIDTLEKDLLDEPAPDTLEMIHDLKRELILLAKQIRSLRDMIHLLVKGISDLIADSTRVYLSDVYDHTFQVIDTIESYRDIFTGLQELYLSTMSHRMNQVMKVLTIIATIFIPLTFLVGVYGMNFRYMPELEWRWGYFAVWGVMVLVTAVMIFYFKKKNWL